MKKEFSISWKSSKKQSKQRKYRVNAQLHIKQKLINSHLSKGLKQKYNKRSVALRKGDKVKVIRGNFKKHEGKVERIELGKTRVYVNGVEYMKKDGTKKMIPLNPSNLMIIELNMDDKWRQEILEK